jgi:hypothetical protein
MRFLAILVAVGVALYLGVILAFPSYTLRYRLTIEIDTPDGARSGSSVIEVTRRDVRWILIAQGRYEFDLRGEAVFVDLGSNRNVIALLTDRMITLPIEAYGYYKWDEAAWTGKAKMEGPIELEPRLVPTLVSFPDLTNPKTGQIFLKVDSQETKQSHRASRSDSLVRRSDEPLGSNVRFRRAWLERVPTGSWPLRILGVTGTPVTHGIEQKIPFLLSHREELHRLIDDAPKPFQPHYHYFKRD